MTECHFFCKVDFNVPFCEVRFFFKTILQLFFIFHIMYVVLPCPVSFFPVYSNLSVCKITVYCIF